MHKKFLKKRRNLFCIFIKNVTFVGFILGGTLFCQKKSKH